MRYRCFKRFDLNNFQKDVSTSKLEIVEIPLTSDRSLKHFYEILNGTLNKHAPIKGKNVVLKRFSVSAVWYLDVREDIHERNKLKQEKKMKDYKKIRNQITSMLRKKKRNFYNDAIKPNPTHVCLRYIVFLYFIAVTNSFKYRQNTCFRDIVSFFFCAVPNRFKYRQKACFKDIVFIFVIFSLKKLKFMTNQLWNMFKPC